MSIPVPIVIYQMGKVGSTAIYNALSSTFNHVYQVHSLVPEKLEKTTRILNEKGLGIPKHVRDSKYIVEHFIQKGLPIKFITPIRSPLQRNMSAFFQELSTEVILKDELRKGLGINSFIKQIKLLPFPNEWKNLLIQKAIQPKLVQHIDFLIEYFKTSYRHRIPLDWFESEFQPATSIDVYQTDFNKNVGYRIYQSGQSSALVLLAELPNEIKSNIIGEFLQIRSIKIPSTHRSASKSYGKIYQQFKGKICLDNEFSSVYRNSKYSTKFY